VQRVRGRGYQPDASILFANAFCYAQALAARDGLRRRVVKRGHEWQVIGA
jgi:hypothetical protein